MDKEKIIFGSIAVIILLAGAYFLGPTGKKAAQDNAGQNNSNINTNMEDLKIEDVVVGSGAEAKAGTVVTVNYTGTFTDGKKFDSSYDRNQPFTFVLGAGQVIQGWDKGVEGMKVGGKRKLTVPSELGYGPNDYGPIPGGSTLLFDVELLDVQELS